MEVAIPGYKTIKVIGKGGMATVYLAIQESFDRQAALKIMSPHLTGDPIFGERFLREAKIIASLNHRNIVPVYDVGQQGNFHYLSMEYLPGGDLKSRLAKGLPPNEALAVIYETASALAYAHSKSYIHRDIKPENILFREDNTSVLTDFGIAKALDTHDANMTSTGMIVGSPHYMSPEQALAKKIDTRSDIYSLGVVLYEVLVGRPLYKADSSVAAAIKHISEPIPRLPQCYEFLQDILEKMVAKKPEDRYQNAEEITQALEPFLMVPAATWGSLKLRNGEYETSGGTKIFTPQSATGARVSTGTLRRPTPLPVNNTSVEDISNKTTAIEMIPWQQRAEHKARKFVEGLKQSPKKIAALTSIIIVPSVFVLSMGAPSPTPIEEKVSTLIEKTQPVIPLSSKLEVIAKKALRAEQNQNLKEAYDHYRSMLELDKDNIDAQAGIDRIAGWYLEQAFIAIEEKKEPNLAKKSLEQAKLIAPSHPNINQVEKQLAKLHRNITEQQQQVQKLANEINTLLSQAQIAVDQGNLITPEGKSANDYFARVLVLDAKNEVALNGITNIASIYEQGIEHAIGEEKLDLAKTEITKLKQVDPQNPKLNQYSDDILKLTEKLEQQEAKASTMLASANTTSAVEVVEMAAQISPPSTEQVNQLLSKAEDALRRERLMFPKTNSAYHFYSQALKLEPGQADAIKGMTLITQKYLNLSSRSLNKGDLSSAEKFVERANHIVSTFQLGEELEGDVGTMKSTISRVTYLEIMGKLELWNDQLKDTESITEENLEKAYAAYMAVLQEDLKNPQVDTANKLYANAFFQLGKKRFKEKDMETSRYLISKGLEINPNHKELKDLHARWQRRHDGDEYFLDRFY